MGKAKNLVGQKFCRLTVIERAENDKYGKARWLCRCDCGKETVVLSGCLQSGHAKSCGCLHRELATIRCRSFKVHGQSHTRLYRIWRAMIQRVCNPKNQKYAIYGGRGISVCEEWQRFEPFYEWAIVNGYCDDLSIDRIDVNKNYEPANCRWVDRKTQQNNRRNNHYVMYNGKSQTLKQWSEEIGIGDSTFRYRLSHGWTIEEALTTPVGESKRHPKK